MNRFQFSAYHRRVQYSGQYNCVTSSLTQYVVHYTDNSGRRKLSRASLRVLRLTILPAWLMNFVAAYGLAHSTAAYDGNLRVYLWIWKKLLIGFWEKCVVKLQDRIPSKGLRERLGLDDIISVLQQNRLQWYGHVLQKEYNDWLMKCMEYEVEGARPRGRRKKTWREIVEKDCQARGLNREDAMDCARWMKQIRGNWWPW